MVLVVMLLIQNVESLGVEPMFFSIGETLLPPIILDASVIFGIVDYFVSLIQSVGMLPAGFHLTPTNVSISQVGILRRLVMRPMFMLLAQ